jgi:hypothetical protein
MIFTAPINGVARQMASIRDYLDIAQAAYHPDPVLGGWDVRKWETATWYGNGFQGGVFADDREVIVAYSGTKGGPTTAPVSQNTANVRIGVFVIPNMAGAGKELVKWAEGLAGGRPISIVGHSLGGALAQVTGAWSGHPFISFNGPGMAAHLKIAAFNIFKPRQMARTIKSQKTGRAVGLCINVKGDFVGSYGGAHIGEVLEVTAPANFGNKHDLATIGHSLSSDQMDSDPWQLSTYFPKFFATQRRSLSLRSSGPSFISSINARLGTNISS